jgi:hypothetical protein
VPRLDVLREAADGREAEDLRRTGALEREHVGTVVDLVRQQPVALAVAREEQQRHAVQPPALHHPRRLAERRRRIEVLVDRHARQVVQAGAADDGQHGELLFNVRGDRTRRRRVGARRGLRRRRSPRSVSL